MKKLFSFLFAVLLSVAISAQTVGMSPFGYGAATTGGGNATPTLVNSVSALQTALSATGNKVIIVTQNLTFTSLMKVKATNKTLMALPGVTLTSLQQNATNSGILYFKSGSSNLILRNLTFVGPGAYDCDGNDLLCFDGVTKAWVDHCDFQDGCDGNFDNKGNTDNVTVSWCRFRYLKAPKAGGSGGTDDHRFSNLLGSSSSDKPADGTFTMTWAYCWWDQGCKERMLRCRNASLHFLNCYWNSSVANYYIGPENVDAYVEGCTINGKPSSSQVFKSYGGKNGSKFVNCVGTVPSNTSGRTVVTPTYSYTALTAAEAKTAITNTSCGAGATLQVSTSGQVSSGCGSAVVNTYTVTFNANGHGTAPAAQTVNEGSSVQQPTAPTASGYTFGGWYKEAACTNAWNFATDKVNSNITLYAKWTASSVTPTPIPGGNTDELCYSLLSQPSLANGITITLNGAAPVYDAINGISLTGNEDYLCIDVSGMGATITSAKVTVKTGSKDATKGFVYGSSCAASFSGTSVLNTEKAFTVYTLSDLNTQVLSLRRLGTSTYISNVCLTVATGGSSTTCTDPALSYAIDEVNKTMGDAAFTNPITNTDGLALTYGSSNTKVATVSSAGKVTLVGSGVATITASAAEQTVGGKLYCAKQVSYSLDVAPAPVYFTLTYDANGGSGSMTGGQYEEGDEVTVSGCGFTAPAGKLFTKWNTIANGSGADYEAGDMLKMLATTTLYAQWTDLPTPSGNCQASVFYCGQADVAGQTQSSYFTGIAPGTKTVAGSLTIGGELFSATQGAQISTSGSIGVEVPANYQATLYVAAASSSSTPRKLKLFDATDTELASLETAASSTQAKQLIYPVLTTGQYSLKTYGGGANICLLALELCPLGATAIETLPVEQTTQKRLINGHLYIIRDGAVYDSMGRRIAKP